MSDIGRMIALAATQFENRLDKGGKPYILHCLKVMHYLDDADDDEDLQCIAVGHDLVEDTKITFVELLTMKFSKRVVEGISLLTRMPGQTEEEYLDKVLSSSDAIRVKLADLRHNSDIRRLKGLTEKDFDRMKKYHAAYMLLHEAYLKLRVRRG